MTDRINKIRDELKKWNLDAIFITNQHNVSYLTGFQSLTPNEREGYFLITSQKSFLLTFPTYFGLYKNGESFFTTLNITLDKTLHQHINEITTKEKVKKIGIEKENLTISEYNSLKNKILLEFLETEKIVEKFRIIKDSIEISNIRKAAKITDQAFSFIKSKLKKGVTEKDLAIEIEHYIKIHADDIAFSPIVAFNQNAAIPHYLPENIQHLTNNSLILLDFGAKVDGYCSDMTRVVFLGKPKSEWINIYNTVLQSQILALESLKTNIASCIPDNIAREYIKKSGYPVYPHGLGHGVGLAIHEAPRLRIDNKETLAENMVVTVEPGIYLQDDCGIRIEDLVVLKSNGIEILSKSSKSLIESIL